MMKPNELRLGNLVKLRDSGEIVAVQRISRKKVGFFHNNDKSRGYFRKYSAIEPVPFLDMFKSPLEEPARFEVAAERRRGGERVVSKVTLYKTFDDYVIEDGLFFKYVHEIQNYHFARYGEELIFGL